MAKRPGNHKNAKSVAASTLSQRDADRFEKSAESYTKSVTSSPKKAQNKLVSLGIHTKSGRISKNYG